MRRLGVPCLRNMSPNFAMRNQQITLRPGVLANTVLRKPFCDAQRRLKQT